MKKNNINIPEVSNEYTINIEFDKNIKPNSNILLFGYIKGLFGHYKNCGKQNIELMAHNNYTIIDNIIDWFTYALSINCTIYIISTNESIKYIEMFNDFLCSLKKFKFNKNNFKYRTLPDEKYKINNDGKKTNTLDYSEWLNELKKVEGRNMKFDYIIQNPPYAGTTHTQFFNKGLDMLSDTGKMTIIEPSTWLINLRKGKGNEPKVYRPMKERVNKHVKKVVIENYNKAFNISMYVPCSITYIDKSKEYDNIEFINCGDKQIVNNINDCNLIGNYELIQGILSKCKNYGDMMKDHIYHEGKTKIDENTWYCKYPEIIGGTGGSLCGIESTKVGGKYDAETNFSKHKYGTYLISYTSPCFHYYMNDINKIKPFKYDRGKHITDKVADCLYGTKDELENWKYFVFNNKLPLFLGISLITDQNNTVKQYTPWITDNQYTDDEIYKMLNINKDEQLLINLVIKKFERNSKWLKRYIAGE